MKLQHKIINSFEVRSISDSGGDMIFEGYGSVFDVIDSYGDMIVKGAFAGAVNAANDGTRWPAMLLQHGFTSAGDTPVGIWTGIEEDDHGLKLTGKIADTQAGLDLYKLMKMTPRPAIGGLSIGYVPIKWEDGEGAGQPERILQEVDLWEISPVTFPANIDAGITDVKSIENLKTIRDIESHLRDAYGMSRTESKALISTIKKSISKRDAGKQDKASEALAEMLKRNINTLRS